MRLKSENGYMGVRQCRPIEKICPLIEQMEDGRPKNFDQLPNRIKSKIKQQ